MRDQFQRAPGTARDAARSAAPAMAVGIAVLAAALSLTCPPLARVCGAAPPDSLSVQQAVDLATASHPAVTRADEVAQAAEARIGSSRSPRYPDLALSGAYTRIGPVPAIDFAGRAIDLAPANNYDLRVGLRQTVYDFGRTAAAVNLAEAGRQSAIDLAEEVRSVIAYRTIAAFNSILILRASIDVLDRQIGDLHEHLEVSRRKVNAGTATDFDVLTTQVRVAAAENDRIEAASALETQEIAFRELVGLAPGSPIKLSGDFDRTERPLDGGALLAAALERRPEIVSARDAEISAELAVDAASLGDRPTVGLTLASGLTTGYPDNLNQLKPNYAAGVDFRVPIFNGHRTLYQRREAEAMLRAARARTEDVRRQITEDVDRSIARVRADWEKYGNARVLIQQAEQAVEMARVRYAAGVITNLDLLDAQTMLTQARLVNLRALYAYTASLVDLDRATGKRTW